MNRLSVAVPASVVSDTPHLREKTSKIGFIGRAAAIFRVDELIIYPDDPSVKRTRETALIADLLAYMETPQYLRKSLFKLKPDLQYAGILPPLRTPHHPLNRRSESLKAGEFREGVVVSLTKENASIDIGVERPALAANTKLSVGRRVTVRVLKTGKIPEVELANRNEVGVYWGYKVSVEERSFGNMMKRQDFELRIATSKYGLPFARVAERICDRWSLANNTLIAFGSPAAGLNEIAAREGVNLKDISDFVVNTIPNQGTETVRTEEAIFASLAVLSATLATET